MKYDAALATVFLTVFSFSPINAQVPAVINHQGRIQVQGTNFTGTGYFKFALGTETMGTVYWSNDGTLAGEPAVAVQGDLDKGLYSIGLGDTALAGMGALDPAVLANTGLWLRVWFSDGALGFEQLVPDKLVASVPYALVAGKVADISGFSVTNLADVTDAGSGMIITDAERALINSNQTTAVNLRSDLDSETAGRIAADAALSGDLAAASNSLSTRITQNETDIASNLSSIASVEYQVSSLETGKVSKTGDTMTGTLNINSASAGGDLVIGTTGTAVTVGRSANGTGNGAAVGRNANGAGYGAGMGYFSDGSDNGAGIGYSAKGGWYGAAIGSLANGSIYGAAVGRSANGFGGSAVGFGANGSVYGAALGQDSRGANGGVAVGFGANGSDTNIAIGVAATASGSDRIAIGRNITNSVNNSAAVRGSLYLDGGTAVYYRATAGSGAWSDIRSGMATGTPVYVEADPIWTSEKNGYATGTPLYAFAESDPNAVLADGSRAMAGDLDMGGNSITNISTNSIVFSDGTAMGVTDVQNWNAAYGWGDHSSESYATGTPVYVETDPVYASEKAGYATGTPVYVEMDGDPANELELPSQAGHAGRYLATDGTSPSWADIPGAETNVVLTDGSRPMSGNLDLGGYGITNIAINTLLFANGAHAIQSSGDTMSGRLDMGGSAITNAASLAFDGSNVQIGDGAQSYSSLAGSVAIGKGATARYRTAGVAIGTEADGDYNGISIGYQSDGQYSNIAIGYQANAYSGYDRIAIGHTITNRRNNSIAVRGSLYLDGGTGVMYRSSFGTGDWTLKAFTIDHPLDPENMVLRHFCLEGPEVLNVYSGNAMLDDAGEAVIRLPDYYDALNKDPRYSLTPIGAKMDLYVKQEISDNQFMVAGGVPGGKISWEVKALRSDPAALEDLMRRPVEQPKSELTPDQMVQENETVNTFP